MIEIGHMALKRTARQLYPSCIMIGILLVFFSVCYSPVLTNDYGFLDEYFDIISGWQGHVVQKRIQEGRPLYAIIYGAITSGGIYVEDLRWFRFAGIVGLSLLAFSVFRVLVYVGWDRFQSFCIVVILCTTLPFQLYVAWATTSIFIFAALISRTGAFISRSSRRDAEKTKKIGLDIRSDSCSVCSNRHLSERSNVFLGLGCHHCIEAGSDSS